MFPSVYKIFGLTVPVYVASVRLLSQYINILIIEYIKFLIF